jgi:twitching motility protein PilI
MLTVEGHGDPALDLSRGGGADWLLPTEALNRFRLPEGTAFEQVKSPKRDVRYGFRVGALNFLIPPGVGSEVIAMVPIAVIPNSPPWLLGMINLRSNLVPVFDLAMICALDRGDDEGGQWILVLDKGDDAVALVINGQPMALSQLSPLSHLPSLPTALRGAVLGGYTVGQELWLEFDHQSFFGSLNESAVSTRR